MKSLNKLLASCLCVFLLLACQKKEEMRSASTPVPAPLSAAKQKADITDKQKLSESKEFGKSDSSKRKVIKEGELFFETSDFNRTKALISAAVSDVLGYIAEESQDRYDDRLESRLVIRVPAASFDKLLETLSSSAAVIDRKNIKVLDVTEEYIDVEARLKTRKDVENRYRQLLGQATKVSDVLGIEKQLGEVREAIESAEGKLKYFNDRIAFSTLTVVYYEKKSSPIGFISKFVHGLSSGWTNFALFIILLSNIWPFIVLAIAAVFLWRKQRKRTCKKEHPDNRSEKKST